MADARALGSITCVFCEIVVADPEARARHDTVLRETPHFLVIPAVGPLVAGHVMVITRAHIGSFSSIPRNAVDEFDGLVQDIAATLEIGASDILFAEHGSTVGQGGACIEHAHINLIPNMANHHDLFDGSGLSSRTIQSTSDLLGVEPPYLYIASTEGRAYGAQGVPSQIIRRELWGRLGRDDWDWALFPQADMIEETIRLVADEQITTT